MNKKDDKIITDAQSRNIPIFVIIAKDAHSVKTLEEYFLLCDAEGATAEHIIAVQERIDEFRQWQIDHPDQVKLPD
jgi:hypothetical protein